MPPAAVSGWDLQPGRYVCVSTKGWLAWLIRTACKSAYNHTVITGPDGQVIEATPRGVHRASLSEYAGMLACANAAEPMTREQGLEVWRAAERMLGDLYDFPDLLAIGAADLGWHWNLVFRALGAGPWRICSQTAALAGRAAKPPFNWLCGRQYADMVTPAEMARRPGVVPVSWAP